MSEMHFTPRFHTGKSSQCPSCRRRRRAGRRSPLRRSTLRAPPRRQASAATLTTTSLSICAPSTRPSRLGDARRRASSRLTRSSRAQRCRARRRRTAIGRIARGAPVLRAVVARAPAARRGAGGAARAAAAPTPRQLVCLHRGCAVDVVLCSSGGGAAGSSSSRACCAARRPEARSCRAMPTAYGELRAPVPAAAGADDACAPRGGDGSGGLLAGPRVVALRALDDGAAPPDPECECRRAERRRVDEAGAPAAARAAELLSREEAEQRRQERSRAQAGVARVARQEPQVERGGDDVVELDLGRGAAGGGRRALRRCGRGALGANWKEGDVALLPLRAAAAAARGAAHARAARARLRPRPRPRLRLPLPGVRTWRAAACAAAPRPAADAARSQQREVEDAVFSGKLSGARPTPVLTPSPSPSAPR